MALTERADEAETDARAGQEAGAATSKRRLMIDSTEADVIRDALEQNPGRAIVNSINMENGRERIEAVMPHVVKHGAAVIALTIDQVGHGQDPRAQARGRQGDPRDRDRGVRPRSPRDLIFDALTFTLATGDPEFNESAIETIEGIRTDRAGAAGRADHASASPTSRSASSRRPAGCSTRSSSTTASRPDSIMAIIHPSHVVPLGEIPAEERELAEDLIFNRRPDALQRFIEHFEGRTDAGESNAADPMADMDARRAAALPDRLSQEGRRRGRYR